jgi:hypothetical protein
MPSLLAHYCQQCQCKVRLVKGESDSSITIATLIGDLPVWLLYALVGGSGVAACAAPNSLFWEVAVALSMPTVLALIWLFKRQSALYECPNCQRVSILAGFSNSPTPPPAAPQPWSSGRPNPSVKGTSCAKAQAAPYVER